MSLFCGGALIKLRAWLLACLWVLDLVVFVDLM